MLKILPISLQICSPRENTQKIDQSLMANALKSLRSVYELHKKLEENQIIIAYEGELNPQITSSVLSITEKNLDKNFLEANARRKAFHIAVECLQNISAHAVKNKNYPNSIFVIGKDGAEYFVSSGNVINANNVESLQRKIDQINKLDRDGLKQLHMQAIKESLHKQESSNAGLGLISIARKSGKKLDYHFVKMDEENSFFSFQASFNNEAKP